MSVKVKYNNFLCIRGYVNSFDIMTFSSGVKMANISIKNTIDNNLTYVKIFGKDGLKYGNQTTNLEGLKKIFLNSDDEPRGVLVEVKGRCSESKGLDKQGNEKVYENNLIWSIAPYSDESLQGAGLTFGGIIENIKYGEKDGESFAKVKVGVMNFNKDKDVTGVDTMTLVAHGDVADKMEEKGIEKHFAATFKCSLLNILPKRDVFGDFVGTSTKECQIIKFSDVLDSDETEHELELYKKAKKLERGETIKVSKDDDNDEEEEKVIVKTIEDDEDDLDF